MQFKDDCQQLRLNYDEHFCRVGLAADPPSDHLSVDGAALN